MLARPIALMHIVSASIRLPASSNNRARLQTSPNGLFARVSASQSVWSGGLIGGSWFSAVAWESDLLAVVDCAPASEITSKRQTVIVAETKRLFILKLQFSIKSRPRCEKSLPIHEQHKYHLL